jgi:hypothetical protein
MNMRNLTLGELAVMLEEKQGKLEGELTFSGRASVYLNKDQPNMANSVFNYTGEASIISRGPDYSNIFTTKDGAKFYFTPRGAMHIFFHPGMSSKEINEELSSLEIPISLAPSAVLRIDKMQDIKY